MADVTLDSNFVSWLEKTPAAFAKFLDVLREFYELQAEGDLPDFPVPDHRPDGPRKIRPDEKPGLTTIPITVEQLDAISKGTAEAHVKEKALEWAKGFIAGLMIVV